MSAATIRARYGSIWPAVEYELDPVTHERTGRTRKRQFVSYRRPHDPKPITTWEFR
jgi:hypothetical protein